MNYLTNYYKNLAENLQQQVQSLERILLEVKAKKDYDGDGKIESGTKEYLGSRSNAIRKAIRLRGKKGKFPKNLQSMAEDLEIEVHDLEEGLQKALRSNNLNALAKERLRQDFRGDKNLIKSQKIRKSAKNLEGLAKEYALTDPTLSTELYDTAAWKSARADQYGAKDVEHSKNWVKLGRAIQKLLSQSK